MCWQLAAIIVQLVMQLAAIVVQLVVQLNLASFLASCMLAHEEFSSNSRDWKIFSTLKVKLSVGGVDTLLLNIYSF